MDWKNEKNRKNNCWRGKVDPKPNYRKMTQSCQETSLRAVSVATKSAFVLFAFVGSRIRLRVSCVFVATCRHSGSETSITFSFSGCSCAKKGSVECGSSTNFTMLSVITEHNQHQNCVCLQEDSSPLPLMGSLPRTRWIVRARLLLKGDPVVPKKKGQKG